MNRRQGALVQAFLTAVKPWRLAAGVLLYALGGAMAAYLGETIDWGVYFTGQGALILLHLASDFLTAYFDRSNQPPFAMYPNRQTDDEEAAPLLPRSVFLQGAFAFLTAGAVLTTLLAAQGRLVLVTIVFLGAAFLLAVAYAVPPFRLVTSGYGELVLAVLLANLFPALAFVLQTGDVHRLLGLLTFPLTFLYLAAELARSLQRYGEDVRTGRMTMLSRLGWQRGMSLHNFLVAAGFLVLVLATIVGLEPRLVLPGFLALPVGAYSIWQITAIANGAKPRWRILNITAAATVGLTAYFLMLSLWFN